MTAIEFDSVTKKFPNGSVAVDQLTLGIEQGETMVLIGPSGCGKTTTLRLLAGLEQPTTGSIMLDGRDVTRVAPADRNVAMMFQSDALYPHMSVRGNLSFGRKLKRGIFKRAFSSRSSEANKSAIRIGNSVEDVAARLGIEKLLDQKPHQLSGGERQRVALGRAIVREPAAFLLDEPLSRLDARLAGELRTELSRVFCDLGKPVLYVTHDQREAMALADRMAVMDRGKVLQVGKPLGIYQRPANLFVANFVGSVPVNVLSHAESNDLAKKWAVSEVKTIGFRAEHLRVSKIDATDSSGELSQLATVRGIEQLGDHSLVYLVVDGVEANWIARCDGESVIRPGDRVEASVIREKLMWFDSTGKRINSSAD